MMNILEYVNCTDEELRDDWEWHIFDNVFNCFLSALPLNPPEVNIGGTNVILEDVWTDGVEILCRREEIAERIANVIEAIAGTKEAHTGYYDPFDDARSGEVDNHTGWYYVDFD